MTHEPRHHAARILAPAALVLALAACGSTAATGTAATSAAGTDFCTTVQDGLDSLASDDAAAALASGDADQLKEYYATANAYNEAIEAAAPAEIADDIAVLTDVALQMQELLEAADYDSSKVDTSTLVAATGTEEYTTATTNFQTYVETECGIDLTATSTASAS